MLNMSVAVPVIRFPLTEPVNAPETTITSRSAPFGHCAPNREPISQVVRLSTTVLVPTEPEYEQLLPASVTVAVRLEPVCVTATANEVVDPIAACRAAPMQPPPVTLLSVALPVHTPATCATVGVVGAAGDGLLLPPPPQETNPRAMTITGMTRVVIHSWPSSWLGPLPA